MHSVVFLEGNISRAFFLWGIADRVVHKRFMGVERWKYFEKFWVCLKKFLVSSCHLKQWTFTVCLHHPSSLMINVFPLRYLFSRYPIIFSKVSLANNFNLVSFYLLLVVFVLIPILKLLDCGRGRLDFGSRTPCLISVVSISSIC